MFPRPPRPRGTPSPARRTRTTAPGALRWLPLAQAYGSRYNIPPELLLAAIQAESGGSQTAVGDRGQSIGLFQLHSRGAGAGYTVAQRYNPQLQFEIMAPRFANAYQQARARGLTGTELITEAIAYAERPAGYNVPGSASRQRYASSYQQIVAGLGSGALGAIIPPTTARAIPFAAPIIAGGIASSAGAVTAPAISLASGDTAAASQGFTEIAFIIIGIILVIVGLFVMVLAYGREHSEGVMEVVKAVAKVAA